MHAIIPNDHLVAPPVLLQREDGGILAICAESITRGKENTGRILVYERGKDQPTILTPESTTYGPPQATRTPTGLAIVCSEYRDGLQRILLMTADEDLQNPTLVPITQYGKFDNPALCLHDRRLWLFWESHQDGEPAIWCRIADFDRPSTRPRLTLPVVVTDPEERAYRPEPLATDDSILLAYESFFAGRYHLLLRTLTDPTSISEPSEAGFDSENDLEPSLALLDGRPLLLWENSSPLYKGFEWIPPRGPTVIIPAFGHGWRVLTRAGTRSISLDEDLIIGIPFSNPEEAPLVILDETESAGAPRLLTTPSKQAVAAFLTINSRPGEKAWKIALRILGTRDSEGLVDTGLYLPGRNRPAAMVDRNTGRIVVAGFDAPKDGSWCIRSFDIPQSAAAETNQSTSRPSRPTIELRPSGRLAIEYQNRSLKLFWGDLHMHTNLSVCSLHPKFHCSELEEKYRFCRDVGDLDFAMSADHDSMSDHEWKRTCRAAHLADIDQRFVAFAGYEWTSSQSKVRRNWGHYNVLYRTDGPLYRTDGPGSETIDELWSSLQKGEVLTIPHHPGDATHPLDWSRFDADFAPLVEIFQVRGSYEADDGPMHPEQYGRSNIPHHSVRDGLAAGYRFGFTAGGEHEGVGVTALFAEELTRDALFAALRDRRVYGTSGARIFMDVRLNGALMGSDVDFPHDTLQLEIQIAGTAPLRTVHVVRNGELVVRWEMDSPSFQIHWEDTAVQPPEPGKHHYYYVVAQQTDDELAWSSPIFVG